MGEASSQQVNEIKNLSLTMVQSEKHQRTKTDTIKEEIEQVPEAIKVVKPSPTKHNEQKEEAKPTEKQKIRQELIETIKVLEEKSARIIKKLTAAMDQQISNANNKLQGVIKENTLLKRQLDQEVSHRRNIELRQATTLNHQLETARAAAASASANLSELEQLRTTAQSQEDKSSATTAAPINKSEPD